jgi:SRSO17 transposase
MVGRADAGQGVRTGDAIDDAAWTDRSLDHRRYVVSQERPALLSIANHHGSLPIAYRLYLPQAWTGDRSRRAKAHVRSSIRFKTKPQLALEQIRAAVAANVVRGAVLMDAGYGTNSGLCRAITGLGLGYVASIISTIKVRAVREDKARQRRRFGA